MDTQIQTKITDFFSPKLKIVFLPLCSSQQNYCTQCFCMLGENNPRQLCGKTWCENPNTKYEYVEKICHDE